MIKNKQIKDIAINAFEIIKKENFTGDQKADLRIESFIFDELKALGGNMKIVSEEYGTLILGEPNVTLIIDPIDGSGNLIRGIPIYSVAMAVCDGLVNKVTVNDIRYSVVVSGFGIFENSRDDAEIVNTDSPLDVNEALLRFIRPFRTRLLGASTVELCLLAHGSLDGFVETKGLKSVDLIPILLILQKNGCYFSDKNGDAVEFNLKTPKLNEYTFIAARTKKLHEAIIEMIKVAR